MTNPTAINKQTGERVELVDGAWKPIIGKVQTFARNFFPGVAENAANVPFALASSYAEAASGFPFGLGPNAESGELAGDVIASLGPDKDEIMAAAQVAGERAGQVRNLSGVPPATFPQALQNQQQISQRANNANPTAAAVGDIGADVASLLAVRAPGSKQRALWDMNQAHAVRLLDSARSAPVTSLTPAAKNLKQFFGTELSSSPLFATLKRGATKMGEAGIDGMILGVMNRQDPLETAALGAGAQAGTSLLMSTLTGFKGTGSWGTRLALEATSIMAILQVGRSLVPGEDASPVSDFGAAIDKIVPAAILGVFGTIAGGGRATGTQTFQKLREVAPALVESSQTAVRGISLDLINGMFADERAQKAVEKLSKNPNAFGPTVGRKIERAISNNQDLTKVLDSLEKSNKVFREKMNNINAL
jgi:hypothetical protein